MLGMGGLTLDQLQQRQCNFDRKCKCGQATYTCALLSVGSMGNGEPRKIHMSGNNRGASWKGSPRQKNNLRSESRFSLKYGITLSIPPFL